MRLLEAFPLPPLDATAAQARTLKQPPVNPLAHLPQVVAELRREVHRLNMELAKVQRDAVTRAHREDRLAKVTVREVDNRTAYYRKVCPTLPERASVILTNRRATA